MQPTDPEGSAADLSSEQRLAVDALNILDDKAACALLSSSSHCEWWAARMLARRPFADLEQIEAAGREVWSKTTTDHWLAAFAGHPLIGDVEHLRQRFDNRAIGEQGQVMRSSATVLEELARLNHDYLARHGFIFIICATGRSAEDMLIALRSRIGRSTEEELATAAREHAAITNLRLTAWLRSHQRPRHEIHHVP